MGFIVPWYYLFFFFFKIRNMLFSFWSRNLTRKLPNTSSELPLCSNRCPTTKRMVLRPPIRSSLRPLRSHCSSDVLKKSGRINTACRRHQTKSFDRARQTIRLGPETRQLIVTPPDPVGHKMIEPAGRSQRKTANGSAVFTDACCALPAKTSRGSRRRPSRLGRTDRSTLRSLAVFSKSTQCRLNGYVLCWSSDDNC